MRSSYSITKSRWHTAFTLCASWARSFSLATSVGLLLPPIEAGGDEFPMNFRLKSKNSAYSPKCLERLYEKASNTDEPPRHEANHRSVHERFSARTKSLVIFAHPPVLADPSDRPLHHPPTR